MNRIAIINPDTSKEIIDKLKKNDLEPIILPVTNLVEKPISGHPDLQIFTHNNKIFCHPDINKSFLHKVEDKYEIIICESKLSNIYPNDIPYNIANIGNFAFHNLKYTDKTIRKYFEKEKIKQIDVKQGYSKCSTLIVDENSIITADKGIHNSALENKIDSLLISSGDIELPGYKYGFIGGASATTDTSVYLTGSIINHPDKKNIENFISYKNKNIIYLSIEKIIDLGTIFILDY